MAGGRIALDLTSDLLMVPSVNGTAIPPMIFSVLGLSRGERRPCHSMLWI